MGVRSLPRGVPDVVIPLAYASHREDQTPVHISAALGDMECLNVFVESGVGMNSQDKKGETPSALAKRRNLMDVAIFLTLKSSEEASF